MKAFKLSLLLCLGLFVSVGSLQAQAKKSCSKPCTKAKSAQVETPNAAAVTATMVSQEKGTQKACSKPCTKSKSTASAGNGTTDVVKVKQVEGNAVKKCDPKDCLPKNCDPKNCDWSNCPPGCCKGMKASKEAKAEVMEVKPKAVKISAEY